jgi:hypothetical protein
MTVDPETPEWTVAWTLRRTLRNALKPRNEAKPDIIAKDVVADLRQSNWLLIRGPSNSGWEHDPAAIRLRQEQQRAFNDKLKALKDHIRSMSCFPSKGSSEGG